MLNWNWDFFFEYARFLKRYLLDFIALFLAFMSPTVIIVWAMFAFVFADLITGIMKARKIGDYSYASVSSRKMSHSVSKFIFYFFGILLAHVTNEVLELGMPAIKMVLGFIVVIELRSIDENMKVVLGYSIFGRMLDMIKRADIPDSSQK